MVQQYLPGLILNAMLETVGEMGDPCQARPGLGDMTAYPPRAMAAVCILMEAEMKTYRKMVGYLRMHPDVVRRIGLPRVPSKSTIWRAYGMIPEPYLREVRLRIVRDIVAGSPAGDSTSHSCNRFVRRFGIRHGRTETKRGWIKLHSIIDISARTILDCHATDGYADGYAADITGMRPMVDRLGAPCGDGSFFCLDSAYLARLPYDAMASRGWMPRILPKSNTVCKNGGSQAWGDMTRTHRDDPGRFMSEYHQRSIIEAVFGAIKKMYGNHLRGRRFTRQKREVAIRVICYNIEVDICKGRGRTPPDRSTRAPTSAWALPMLSACCWCPVGVSPGGRWSARPV